MAAEDGLSFLIIGKWEIWRKCSLLPALHYASVRGGNERKKKTACLAEACERKLCLISLGNPFWVVVVFLVLLSTFIKNPSIASLKNDWSHASCHRRAIFNIPFSFHCCFSLVTVSINFVLLLWSHLEPLARFAYFFWMWKCIFSHLVLFFFSFHV